MERYRAVEYLFDCRADRPSFDDTVFCRDMGTCEEEEEVDALERCGMTAAADILDQGPVEEGLVPTAKGDET